MPHGLHGVCAQASVTLRVVTRGHLPLAPRPDRFDDLVDGTKWQRLASTGPGAYTRMRRVVHTACPSSRLAVQALQVFHSWALAICDEDALRVDRWQGSEDVCAADSSDLAATWLVQGYECWSMSAGESHLSEDHQRLWATRRSLCDTECSFTIRGADGGGHTHSVGGGADGDDVGGSSSDGAVAGGCRGGEVVDVGAGVGCGGDIGSCAAVTLAVTVEVAAAAFFRQ